MMKTTEERAATAWGDYEYREGRLYENCFCDGYLQGAIDEREELTRWHDPKEQPEDGCICLLKFQSNGFFVHYEGAIFTEKDGEWHDSENMFTYNRDVILAWRPIHDMQ